MHTKRTLAVKSDTRDRQKEASMRSIALNSGPVADWQCSSSHTRRCFRGGLLTLPFTSMLLSYTRDTI